jgi:hypothetical protein
MTRFDYEYIRDNNATGWQEKWGALLSGRFVVQGNVLIEDSNAEIFRLGFSVAEVEAAVSHSGYTERELQWYTSQPDRYELIDGQYVEAADYPAKRLAAEKSAVQQANKAACTAHILGRYPMPIQQSAALGVYPVDVRDTMVEFIAACIAEENRVFDLVEAATSIPQLAAISGPTWPEWPKE